MLAALILFAGIRRPLLTHEGIARGWTSDAAVVGLAGKRTLEQHQVNVFFWGQNYLGPLTSLTEAGIAGILLPLGMTQEVWPLALRLATMTEVALGIVFFWLGLRLAFGRWAAFLAALWLAIGPTYLYASSLLAWGDEVVFPCAGILFFLAARCFAPPGTSRPRDSLGGCLLLGLASGFSWWMHQGVVLVLLPAAAMLFFETETWAGLRRAAKPLDRLLLKGERLGWRRLSEKTIAAARAWNMLLLAAAGIVAGWALGLPIRGLGDPAVLGALVVALLASPMAFELAFGDKQLHRRASTLVVSEGRRIAPRLSAFAMGALLGFSPVIAGRVLGWYPLGYGRRLFALDLANVPEKILRVVREDFWGWIGAERSIIGVIVVAGMLVSLLAMTARSRRQDGTTTVSREGPVTPRMYAGAVIAFCLLFDVLALQGKGPVHYLTPGVAPAYGMAAAGLVWLARPRESPWAERAGRAGAVILAAAFLTILAVKAGGLTRQILAESDPRVLLARIQSAGYRICYANYWDAYRLQFVSAEAVAFIPYKSPSRNRRESDALAREPEEKCLLFPDGTFRRFLPEDRPIPIEARRAGPATP